MSTNGSNPDFLLQVTLLKTSNPVVSRLLSAPANITFWELHEAIKASFGWTDDLIAEEEDRSTFPSFMFVKGNPFEAERVDGLEVVLDLLRFGDGRDVNTGDPCYYPSMGSVRLYEVLDNFRFRENFVNYAYDEDFFHVIQLLGRSGGKPGERIVCLGGQGYITQKVWDQGRTAGDGPVRGGPSSWDLDLDEVNARVEEVEDRRFGL